MKVKRDQITGAILIVFGIVIAILTSGLKATMSASYPGAKFLPLVSAVGMIICGAGIIVASFVNPKEDVKFMDKAGVIRAASTFGILVAYVALMNFFGFLITTPFMLYATCTLFAKGEQTKLSSRIIFSIVATAFVYVVYTYFFGVHLPGITIFG